MVEVPQVVGFELGDTREVIERAGLIPIADFINDRNNDEAVVNEQNPEPTTVVRKGSSVVLTLRVIAPHRQS